MHVIAKGLSKKDKDKVKNFFKKIINFFICQSNKVEQYKYIKVRNKK